MVTTGAGNRKYIEGWKAAGIKGHPGGCPRWPWPAGCDWAGADAVIAEGTEAGG